MFFQAHNLTNHVMFFPWKSRGGGAWDAWDAMNQPNKTGSVGAFREIKIFTKLQKGHGRWSWVRNILNFLLQNIQVGNVMECQQCFICARNVTVHSTEGYKASQPSACQQHRLERSLEHRSTLDFQRGGVKDVCQQKTCSSSYIQTCLGKESNLWIFIFLST